MIFKEINDFEKIKEVQLLKKQVNGFNDPCLREYFPLLFSAVSKKDCKEDEMKKEYITSFLEAAKSLAKEAKNCQPSIPGIIQVFYNYSLILPTLYLCRHSIEISLKYSLEMLKISYGKIHKLKELWDELITGLPKKLQNGKERTILTNMGEFVSYINDLDENGQRLRYAIQNSGKLSQEEFLWVNLQNVVDNTEKFINQLKI